MLKLQIIYKNHQSIDNKRVKRTILLFLVFFANAVLYVASAQNTVSEPELSGNALPPKSRFSLWYKQPAKDWMKQALPIGNGQFGGMIFGGVCKDEVQFNDKTLWTGSASIYGSYQNFGSVNIESTDIRSVTDYRRELDLENAVAKVSFKVKNVVYTREYFASYPDSVLVIHYKASKSGRINIRLTLDGAHNEHTMYEQSINSTAKNKIKFETIGSFSGKLDLLHYYAKISVKNLGGSLSYSEKGIKIENANEVTVILRGNTNFLPTSPTYTFPEILLQKRVNNTVTDAVAQSYRSLRQKHITDYKHLYQRMAFDIDETTNELPTDELIDEYARKLNSQNDSDAVRPENKHLFLEVLYFHYGRYLMISSARGISLPSNLQGIWNNSNNPPWCSDIHSNINVQMNYWAIENTNLSELHSTFLDYIFNEAMIHPQWQKNALNSGQSKGWTIFTENNIFGYHGDFMHNYVIANAWYCMHLWQHYRYTLDLPFLREKAFPVMKSCCDFWMERLVKADDGMYECPNEYLPEHGPEAENATAHSQQLVWDLFNNTLQAIELLGENSVDATFYANLKDKFDHLDKGTAIEEETGELREWKYSPNSVGAPHHRHLSHLVGMYPGNQISFLKDTAIFNAAKKSLIQRGDISTGWSMGWKINLWARALDGHHAQSILQRALRLSKTKSVNQYDGGIYQNLLDSHAPFQIDGNFGACAGIAEMLLQSYTGVLQILPALPATWQAGHISGLKAVGNFEVDINWSKCGVKKNIMVKSLSGGICEVFCENIGSFIVRDNKNNLIYLTVLDKDRIQFSTRRGGRYRIFN
ncbi:MAG: glycoside hydrolase family 95 protein [Paludibacteraceae bacterium]